MFQVVDRSSPPRYPLCERAREIVRNLDAGRRGDWRGGWGMQDRMVVYRAQAARECAGETDPYLRGGRIQARTLELVPVTIDPLHLFAANALPPGFSDQERGEAYGYLGTQHLLGHSHHISLDYRKLLRLGIDGILNQITSYERRPGLTHDQKSFYEGTRLALEGLKTYGRRYQAEARRLLETETNPARAAEFQRIIDALDQVPAKPARTMFEAIQSHLLLHFGSRTCEMDSAFGRLDYDLGPFYERDLAAGRITREEAALWIQVLLAHLLELTRFSDCVVLGGTEADGITPFHNDLTYVVLDAMAELQIPDPEIGFRYAPGQPRELMRRAMACVKAGTGHPGFLNDPVCIAALERAGMTREQASDYANCNCVELTSCGRSSIVSGYGYLNLVKPFEILLNGGRQIVEDANRWIGRTPEPPPRVVGDYPTFDSFLDAFERYLDHGIDLMVQETDQWMRSMASSTPLPLSSAFIEGCLESGKHSMLGGALCQQTFPTFVGFVNAVNGLLAVRTAVYEKRTTTLAELGDALRNNFQGYEPLRQFLRTKCPRYGNDIADADAIAVRLFDRLAARLSLYRNIYGQAYAPQFFGWMTHATRGETTAASPDGRLKGEAVSGTMGGDNGTDECGPTALLNSVTSFDHTLCSGGLTVNLALSPSMLRSAGDIERMIDLTLAYFAKGGMQIQFNCVSTDTLRQAQQDPAQHRNLLVRVAGYCDRFICLPRNLQEDIIHRTQHDSWSR
jgi:(2S)-3-sulfopropanediol dehydratase